MRVPLTAYPAGDSLSGREFSGLTLLVAVAVLLPVCFWVYNDARMRYNGRSAPLLWSALVFSALIVFLPAYLMLRPPRRRTAGTDRPPDTGR